jgi:hypothetical protein
MKAITGTRMLIWLLVLYLAVPTGLIAQGSGQPAGYVYTQEQLDQLLAPIALYPDSLLSQMLMASTYPLEVVEADRWLKENPNFTGDILDEALRDKPWDVSVKSLCQFPNVLATMSEHLDETVSLGDAFLGQQEQVMDTIQQLRAKARAQGNLRSTNEQRVVVEGQSIVIEPINPEVVYVPFYDPCWCYGAWWYPVCSPIWFWYPNVIVTGIFVFSRPIHIGHFGPWCGFFWRQHAVFVDARRTIGFSRVGATRVMTGPQVWQHDPVHRRGVIYRDEATRQRFGQTVRPGVDVRRNFRGFGEAGPGAIGPGIERQGVPRSAPEVQRTQPQGVAPQGTQPPRRELEPAQPRVPETRQLQPRMPEVQRVEPRGGTGGFSRGGFEQPSGGIVTFHGLGSGPEIRQQSERGRESMGLGSGTTAQPGVGRFEGGTTGGGIHPGGSSHETGGGSRGNGKGR